MDIRAEKLAKARKKLKDHQEKKTLPGQRSEQLDHLLQTSPQQELLGDNTITDTIINEKQNAPNNSNQIEVQSSQDKTKSTVDVTEILISNKTNLELQINDLNEKLSNLENLHRLEVCNHNVSKQKIIELQSEVNDTTKKHSFALQEAVTKDENILNLNNIIKSLKDENSNLSEQLEFTKSILTSKEYENSQLQNQILSYQTQLDQLQVQIQQLTNDSSVTVYQDRKASQEINTLLQKVPNLEQRIETLQKERDHIQSHYEHYVQELNKQLRSEVEKNEKLGKDLQNLYNRESSLIDQISDMEIRIQNYKTSIKTEMSKQCVESDIETKYIDLKHQFEEINNKYDELDKKYIESVNKIQVLTQEKERETAHENLCGHDNVDISKLTADMTSDKLAAQRATEQNKKLKLDIERLEQVIVKMGKDKLDLTEKWIHEKQLNKGLALKLADVEENAKNMHKQIKAKDDEMIRLQGEYREMESKYEKMLLEINQIKITTDTEHDHELPNEKNNNTDHKEMIPLKSQSKFQKIKTDASNISIQREDAMFKLQERFLNIMDEVANLSDEKHRLEHIILQLQNETDTICEYVALYQQQRSLLKRREEDRSNQLKIFQTECDKLKQHLEELSDLLLRIAADEQLALLLKEESRHDDLVRVKELLIKLQNCSLINPKFKNLDLNVFYPCNCCSGQLINI